MHPRARYDSLSGSAGDMMRAAAKETESESLASQAFNSE